MLYSQPFCTYGEIYLRNKYGEEMKERGKKEEFSFPLQSCLCLHWIESILNYLWLSFFWCIFKLFV